MNQHLRPLSAGDSAPRPEWQEALDDLEQSLHQALRSIALLRHELERGARQQVAQAAPPPQPSPPPPAAPASYDEPSHAPGPTTDRRVGPSETASFERLWERVEQERSERQVQAAAPAAGQAGERHGLDSLPQSYLMTVEDREGSVDLIPLHRALTSISNVEEVSLASYANGVPVVSMRVEGELNLEELGNNVSTAMDRECEVIPQDLGKIYLRMRAWGEQ